jgi:hypothetical protein
MDYVRVVEAFATDALSRRGKRPDEYLFARARVLFRRPCFLGEWYRLLATRFVEPDGEEILAAAVHSGRDPEGSSEGAPAAAVRLDTRNFLLSSPPRDKGP